MEAYLLNENTIKKKLYTGIDRVLDNRWMPIFLAILFFSIPFIVHAKALLAGNTIVGGDGITLGFYYIKAMGDSVRAGEFPLWTPYLSGGQPLFNFYPIMILCGFFSVAIQMPAYFGFHLALGGTFLFLYLKKIGCTPTISLAVSIIYLFTIHMGGFRKEHVYLIVASLYVPVILFFLEIYLQKLQFRFLLAGSIAMAWQLIGGFLQYCIYSDIFCFSYLLYFGIQRKIKVKVMLTHGIAWVVAYFAASAVFVLPVGVLMSTLLLGGGIGMEYVTFVSYSMNPIKFVMTVFPYIFGNDVWRPLSNNWWNCAGEMDVEIMTGAVALAIIIAAITLFKQNKYVRFMAITSLSTFLYACMGNIPLLGHIIYHIPILNMFRVPARVLFLYMFALMVMLGISLNSLKEKEIYEKKLERVHFGVLLGMLTTLIFLCGVNCSLLAYRGPETELLIPWGDFKKIFIVPFTTFGIYMAIYYIGKQLRRRGRLTREVFIKVITLSVAALTIFQLWPFYSVTYRTPLAYLFEDMPQAEYADATTAKAWVDGGWQAVNYTFNRGIEARVGVINSYSNYHTNSLYKYMARTADVPINYSGLYLNPSTLFQQSISENNGIFSAFGIKYLITPAEEELDKIGIIKDYNKEQIVLSSDSINLSEADGYQIASWEFEPEQASYYQITLYVDAPKKEGEFYVDFAGGDYDNIEQQKNFNLEEGRHEYTAVLPSGDPKASSTPVQFRIVALTEQELSVSKLEVTKLSVQGEYPYHFLKKSNEWSVYENVNAKPLLYVPKKVSFLPEEERNLLYVDSASYDFLNTAYLFDPDTAERSNGTGSITDLQLTDNTISAKAYANGETFFTLSQTFYPGWHVYIDGKKTELFEVDGLMQGVFVPDGKHELEFRFEPWYVYLGATLSIGMMLLCAVWFIVCFAKERRKAVDEERGVN